MTRKQALHNAIKMLSKTGKHQEEISILEDIITELPITHWSDSSIRDAVEQFIIDNGRIPTVTDFKKKGMPPHPVIKQKYKITLKEWLNENYPTVIPNRTELNTKNTNMFIEDYLRIKPKTEREFQNNKREETKGWRTIASYYNVTSWRQLLNILKLPLYYTIPKDRAATNIKINFFVDYDFKD